jgi:hypothetical protein
MIGMVERIKGRENLTGREIVLSFCKDDIIVKSEKK